MVFNVTCKCIRPHSTQQSCVAFPKIKKQHSESMCHCEQTHWRTQKKKRNTCRFFCYFWNNWAIKICIVRSQLKMCLSHIRVPMYVSNNFFIMEGESVFWDTKDYMPRWWLIKFVQWAEWLKFVKTMKIKMSTYCFRAI